MFSMQMSIRVRGGYERYEVGTRGMRWVRGGYEGYEVGTRGTRWVQGVRGR